MVFSFVFIITIWQLIIYLIKSSYLIFVQKVRKGMNERQRLDPEGEADRWEKDARWEERRKMMYIKNTCNQGNRSWGGEGREKLKKPLTEKKIFLYNWHLILPHGHVTWDSMRYALRMYRSLNAFDSWSPVAFRKSPFL